MPVSKIFSNLFFFLSALSFIISVKIISGYIKLLNDPVKPLALEDIPSMAMGTLLPTIALLIAGLMLRKKSKSTVNQSATAKPDIRR